MREKWNPHAEFNEAEMSLTAFLEYYNRTMPISFPRATEKALRRFRTEHSALFEQSSGWSIDKHRKRLMDWLPSFKEEE